MATLDTMYPGMPYSPQTALAQPFSDTATDIYVEDSSVFPDAPNVAGLGTDGNAETVIYGVKNVGILSNVQRGVQEGGVGKVWPAGTVIARYFTEMDQRAMQDNISALNAEKAEAYDGLDSTSASDALSANQGRVLDGNISSETARATAAEGTKADASALAVTAADLLTAVQIINRVYPGVDLTVKFATEIAEFSSVWAWIQARIQAANWTGLNVGDYIPWTSSNGYTVKSEIVGIDTYYDYGDVAVGHHIDFISRDCWPEAHVWNKANYNNGTTESPSPWLASDICAWLNSLQANVPNAATATPALVAVDYTATGVYDKLPAALQAVIIPKRFLAPTRYTAGQLLTDENSSLWSDIGKLWIPYEVEIFGREVWGSRNGYSDQGMQQYTRFANNMERVKTLIGTVPRVSVWLASAHGASSSNCCHISRFGNSGQGFLATSLFGAPVCFRIA